MTLEDITKQSDAHTRVESRKSNSYKRSGVRMCGFGRSNTTSAVAVNNAIFLNGEQLTKISG